VPVLFRGFSSLLSSACPQFAHNRVRQSLIQTFGNGVEVVVEQV